MKGELAGVPLHPIDEFFANPDELSVVREETLEGHKTLVVERSHFIIAPDFYPELNGRLSVVGIHRAWIDPAHGFLPRRMMQDARWIVDGKEVECPVRRDIPLQPDLDEVEIAHIDGAGFYPVRGKIKGWAMLNRVVSPGILDVVDKNVERPLSHGGLIDESHWTGSATAKAPETVYDLKTIVPPGVLVVDVRTQTVLAQNDQGELIRARADQLGTTPTRSNRQVILIATMVLMAIVFVFAGVWIMRRTTKR